MSKQKQKRAREHARASRASKSTPNPPTHSLSFFKLVKVLEYYPQNVPDGFWTNRIKINNIS